MKKVVYTYFTLEKKKVLGVLMENCGVFLQKKKKIAGVTWCTPLISVHQHY